MDSTSAQDQARPAGTAAPGAAAPEAAAGMFTCVLPLRWSDQDLNGHVNNARIVTLMEEARVLWLNRQAASAGVGSFSDPKVVASLNVEYRRPVEYDRQLEMELWISRIGSRSFTIAYRALQSGEACFTGSTVLVPLDPAAGTSRTLQPAETDYLSRYLSPTEPPR
ncbi:acyl-CoA thioesterase [Arthrobacter zhangbolii]|uniref:Acyl-CoA thioesterase n=1 Tax=Arthrobacter zhangbolii TaxID=2886936 RepID=A0A9X1MA07_9MICC|nr:thioesterase family protein [Arthrobacter zhangbolii]MCC3274026.1 acyl-CoA thioesterase [Arthrobacter zhangbolii]UON92820.1 acyl-CoA thioesterase [Arthrobacter zhangbolii]